MNLPLYIDAVERLETYARDGDPKVMREAKVVQHKWGSLHSGALQELHSAGMKVLTTSPHDEREWARVLAELGRTYVEIWRRRREVWSGSDLWQIEEAVRATVHGLFGVWDAVADPAVDQPPVWEAFVRAVLLDIAVDLIDVHWDIRRDEIQPVTDQLSALVDKFDKVREMGGRMSPARIGAEHLAHRFVPYWFRRPERHDPRIIFEPRWERAPGADRFIVIACGKKKTRWAQPARDLYTGSLFRDAKRHAEDSGQPWAILSAKHGLVHPDQWLDPYEQTIGALSSMDKRFWAISASDGIRKAFEQAGLSGDVPVEFHVGAAYLGEGDSGSLAWNLNLPGVAIPYTSPLRSLDMLQRRKWYSNHKPTNNSPLELAPPPNPYPRKGKRSWLSGVRWLDEQLRPLSFEARVHDGDAELVRLMMKGGAPFEQAIGAIDYHKASMRTEAFAKARELLQVAVRKGRGAGRGRALANADNWESSFWKGVFDRASQVTDHLRQTLSPEINRQIRQMLGADEGEAQRKLEIVQLRLKISRVRRRGLEAGVSAKAMMIVERLAQKLRKLEEGA